MIYQQIALIPRRALNRALSPALSPASTSAPATHRGVLDVLSFNRMSMAIISAGVLQLSGAALAQTSPVLTGRAQEAFMRADTNQDGKLSKQEAEALPMVAESFDKADADKDGFLSPAEFAELVKEVGDAKDVKP